MDKQEIIRRVMVSALENCPPNWSIEDYLSFEMVEMKISKDIFEERLEKMWYVKIGTKDTTYHWSKVYSRFAGLLESGDVAISE